MLVFWDFGTHWAVWNMCVLTHYHTPFGMIGPYLHPLTRQGLIQRDGWDCLARQVTIRTPKGTWFV